MHEDGDASESLRALLPRRRLLLLGAVAGAAACGGDDPTPVDDPVDPNPPDSEVTPPPDVPVSTCSQGLTAIGQVADFPQGAWRQIGTPRLIVGHDDSGLYAYTSVCTHRGCTIHAPNASGVATCPCHGAQFDGDGAVVRGPATRPLVHYALTICDGVVYADMTQTVPVATRTTVDG
jgi:Rieske Fe-S protein